MKENKVVRNDWIVVLVLSVLLLGMLISGINKANTQNSEEWNVADSVIVKREATYKLYFTDGETSEVPCYVADLFDNNTQFFCADQDYEFINIYGNIVKIELVEK